MLIVATSVCACELQNHDQWYIVFADTLLGPYLGKAVRREQVETDHDNQWLWEVSLFIGTACMGAILYSLHLLVSLRELV